MNASKQAARMAREILGRLHLSSAEYADAAFIKEFLEVAERELPDDKVIVARQQYEDQHALYCRSAPLR